MHSPGIITIGVLNETRCEPGTREGISSTGKIGQVTETEGIDCAGAGNDSHAKTILPFVLSHPFKKPSHHEQSSKAETLATPG